MSYEIFVDLLCDSKMREVQLMLIRHIVVQNYSISLERLSENIVQFKMSGSSESLCLLACLSAICNSRII